MIYGNCKSYDEYVSKIHCERVNSCGHVVVTLKSGKRMIKSRFIYAWKLGHKVPKGKHIHHIDINPLNNRLENLMMLTPKQHQRLHNKLNALDKSASNSF